MKFPHRGSFTPFYTWAVLQFTNIILDYLLTRTINRECTAYFILYNPTAEILTTHITSVWTPHHYSTCINYIHGMLLD